MLFYSNPHIPFIYRQYIVLIGQFYLLAQDIRCGIYRWSSFTALGKIPLPSDLSLVYLYSYRFSVNSPTQESISKFTQENSKLCLPHIKEGLSGLSGVLRNKGTWSFTFREQGNKREIKLGTREQKHSLGNREHLNRREHGPPPPQALIKRSSHREIIIQNVSFNCNKQFYFCPRNQFKGH